MECARTIARDYLRCEGMERNQTCGPRPGRKRVRRRLSPLATMPHTLGIPSFLSGAINQGVSAIVFRRLRVLL
jgi:hypothetical protein